MKDFRATTLGKTIITAIYVAISAIIGYLITLVTNDPGMFGVYAPIVNIVLVAVAKLLDPKVKNI